MEITKKELIQYLVSINKEVFTLSRITNLGKEGKELLNRTLKNSYLDLVKYEFIYNNLKDLKEKHFGEYRRGSSYYYNENYLKLKRDFAKNILKILNQYGIKSKIIYDNGTTEPSGTDGYDCFFALKPNSYYDNREKPIFSPLYLNFSEKISERVNKVLKYNDIDFEWDGKTGSCFIFNCNNWL